MHKGEILTCFGVFSVFLRVKIRIKVLAITYQGSIFTYHYIYKTILYIMDLQMNLKMDSLQYYLVSAV